MEEFKKVIEEMIELLPDWAKGSPLKIVVNQELVAKWDVINGVQIKTVRCAKCGECCMDVPEDHLPFGTNGEGKCNMLTKEGLCNAGHQKPLSCLDTSQTNTEICSMRYK